MFQERTAGTYILGAPGVPTPVINRVFIQPGASPGAATAAIERMSAGGANAYFAHLHSDAPPELTAALQDAGLTRYPRAWVKLARGQQPLPPGESCANDDDVVIARADQAEAFAALVVDAFGFHPTLGELLVAVVKRPRWHVYFAQRAGLPIATGALFVQGDVGYLGFGATHPEHRGQGLQRRVLAKRIRVALAQGCRLVISETGEAVPQQRNASYDNMVALGMRPVGVRDNYALPGVRF